MNFQLSTESNRESSNLNLSMDKVTEKTVKLIIKSKETSFRHSNLFLLLKRTDSMELSKHEHSDETPWNALTGERERERERYKN